MPRALIVVDVQSYFIQSTPEGFVAKIVKHIKNSSYDSLIFTVFKNNSNSNFVKSLNWNSCLKDSDIQLASELLPFISNDKNNIYESKSTYSALKSSGLKSFLLKNNIDKLDICGIDTDACVLATAFEAFDLGYRVNILFDLCFSTGELEQEAYKILRRNIIDKNNND